MNFESENPMVWDSHGMPHLVGGVPDLLSLALEASDLPAIGAAGTATTGAAALEVTAAEDIHLVMTICHV